MVRRGFTLFELLVVLAIVALALALVIPMSMSRLGSARYREASSQVEAFLALGRAEAQRRGEILRIVARPRAFGDEHRLVLERAEAPVGAVRPGSEPVPMQARADLGMSLALPPGIRIADTPPIDPWGGADAALAATAEAGPGDSRGQVSGSGLAGTEPGRYGDEPEGLIVAVFLPDGQVIAPPDRYLVQEGTRGRAGRIRINTWTGAVRVEEETLAAEFPGPEGASPAPIGGPGAGAEGGR